MRPKKEINTYADAVKVYPGMADEEWFDLLCGWIGSKTNEKLKDSVKSNIMTIVEKQEEVNAGKTQVRHDFFSNFCY